MPSAARKNIEDLLNALIPGFPLTKDGVLAEGTTFNVPRDGQCIYFLFDQGDLAYIGQSTSLLTRLHSHVTSGRRFDCVSFFGVPAPLDISLVEQLLIRIFRPTENVQHNHAGE